MKSDLNTQRLSTVELAEVFGVTSAAVRRLTRERVLRPAVAGSNGRGGSAFYALGPSTRSYLEFIARDRGDKGKGDLLEEQTRKLKLANDETESNVVDTGNLETLVAEMLSELDAELVDFAARVPLAARAAMEREVEASRQRIATAMRSALKAALTGDYESEEAA